MGSTGYDVRIRAWASGQYDWFPLASAVSAETVEIFRETALWDIDAAESESAADPVALVTSRLTDATGYAVWMRYPSSGGKVPWGLIADRLTPDQAAAYALNPQLQLNIQPAADRSTPPPVEEAAAE
ncbi:hypothetical protein [Saccharopolyspora gloriosae]|uniref:hypothetical protein n=1 Tax=Saccharopolyspora gloriosae TaxID=455344 RepID=UPI001FB860B9|nr:hypothetical protein [Saccharopolyspora gloriosae]